MTVTNSLISTEPLPSSSRVLKISRMRAWCFFMIWTSCIGKSPMKRAMPSSS